MVETNFFDFLVKKSSVLRNRTFQKMLNSGQWKQIFWLVQTIFYIFFQRLLSEKAFLSSGNLFLNKSFILAIGEGFFYLMETVTLLESFFLLAKTVTAMSGKQFLKDRTYSCCWKLIFWLVETIWFHCLIYFFRSPSFQLAETYFSVQKNSIVFSSELSFMLVKTIIQIIQRHLYKTLLTAIGNNFL